jgi:hypothetical protein
VIDEPPPEPDEPDGEVVEDGEPEAEPGAENWERPIDKFRRSGAGSVIAAGLLGVRDALEGRPEREEPAIVSQAPEPKLDHIDIVLDPDHPERSRAVVYLPRPDDTPAATDDN